MFTQAPKLYYQQIATAQVLSDFNYIFSYKTRHSSVLETAINEVHEIHRIIGYVPYYLSA